MNKTIAPALLLTALLCGTASAQQDNALRCNGRTDHVRASAHITAANDFTMEAWVYPAAPHQIDNPAREGYAGMDGQHYAIYPTHGTEAWGAGHAGAGISVGTNGITVYEHARYYIPAVLTYEGSIQGWTHVAVVYRDGTPSLYINGELVKSGAKSPMNYVHPSGGNSNEAGWLTGGIGGGPYGYFEGAIDNVRVWNTPLGAKEIRASMGGAIPDATKLALNYDMNRSGEGRDLKVGGAGSPGLAGITAGTASTPVFEPRTRASIAPGAATEQTIGIAITPNGKRSVRQNPVTVEAKTESDVHRVAVPEQQAKDAGTGSSKLE